MNFTEEQDKTLHVALTVWGRAAQEAMAIGECGEFLALQGKRAQGRATSEDWISEIADVMIMMEQMAKIHGYDEVQKMVEYKMNRLRLRLESCGAKAG